MSENTGGLVPCSNKCTLCHLIIGFEGIFKWLRNILLVVSILFITLAGVLYMVSAGSKGLMDFAKKAITYSLMGFALFLISWLLVASILTALGYNQVGSWSTFSCDTTQATGPQMPVNQAGTGAGTGTGTGTGTGAGTGATTDAGGNLSNTIYEYGAKYYDSNGVLHTDCSGYAEERRIAAGLGDPGRDTATQMKSMVPFDESQLREGSLIFTPGGGESGRHVVVYNGDGTVSNNSGTGVNVVVVPLAQYISSRNITGMLI